MPKRPSGFFPLALSTLECSISKHVFATLDDSTAGDNLQSLVEFLQDAIREISNRDSNASWEAELLIDFFLPIFVSLTSLSQARKQIQKDQEMHLLC